MLLSTKYYYYIQFHSSLLMQENQQGVLKQNLELYYFYFYLFYLLEKGQPLKGSLPITETSLERRKIQESV